MSNSVVKRVLDWNEKKLDELDGTKKSDYVKVFGHGMIDGFVDSAVIWFIPTLITAYYWMNEAKKK